ncbi:MAG TPA: DUF669 domain-containing protein [Pirellulales bacterium]|nr:DUF669 domain-containing protein [Pirellulales bacterium]
MARKSLSDILRAGDREKLASAWNSTEAAKDLLPLPKGDYVATVESGENFNAQTGTPGYKLTFRIVEGEHTGRRFWHDVWLTEAALSMTKRDLGKIGVTSLDQLERPLPQGIVCAVKLVLLTDDDRSQHNKVKSLDLLRIDVPTRDPFAPSTNGEHQADAEHRGTDDSEVEGGEPE